MSKETQLGSQLWEQFQQAAREQRRNPSRLLAQVVKDYLEIHEDEKLYRQMQLDARKSGYKEDSAVALSLQVRREMKARRAAP